MKVSRTVGTARRELTAIAVSVLPALLLVVALSGVTAQAGVVNWTGTTNTSWATTTNWSPTGGPAIGDTASFTDTGSVSLLGTDTSVLNATRTIGGLSFVNSASHYQTLNLSGFTLSDTGNLSFNTDQNTNTVTTLRNGSLNVTGAFANISVGRGVSGSAIATADLSGVSSLTGSVQNMYVGVSASGSATGTLSLGASTNLTATLVQIGVAVGSGDTNGTLHLGAANTLSTTELDIAKDNGTGNMDMVNGGSLNLGSAASRTLLQIGNVSVGTNNTYAGNLNLAGGSLNAYLSSLVVGQDNNGGFGGSAGTLTAGTGTIDIGASGNTANFYVGRALSTATATGTVNFASLSSLTANLNTFSIGTGPSGTASGNVALAAQNNINALSIIVGSSGNGSSILTLGRTNVILANQFTVGQDYSNGTVTLPAGGSLTLGSPGQLAGLSIGTGNTNTNNTYVGKVDLSAGSFTGYLASVVIGQKDGGGFGNATGTLLGGTGGSVTIGAPGTNTANFIVANQLNNNGNASATGTVNFSGESTFTANVNTFSIGTASTGAATGTVTLASSNTINATTITVGSYGGNTNALVLGQSNTISANQFAIGRESSNATVTVPAGGNLNLGTALAPTALSIGVSTQSTNTAYSGKLDLTGATFTAYLSGLTAGQRDGGGGGTNYGSIIGGTGGAVTIGTSGNSANVYIGRSLTGGAPVTGSVDFSGLATFTASLNTLSLGTSQSGGAQGTLLLAASNNINATNIIVGQSGGSSDLLALGKSNTILANQITIGQDYSNAAVTIPSGGSLTLGSAAAPVNLSMAIGTTNTNSTYGGTFDLTNATLTAYLGNVIIGQKDTQPGSESGTLTISNNAANYINAASITLGGNQSTGTLNYGGGIFYAGTIARGTGTANFNWSGGTLSVGTFGTLAQPFNLINGGTGTLAPGTAAGAIATTAVNGNYSQASTATMAIRIAGNSPGSGNDQLAVSGLATLAGNLNLSLTNSFVPAVGQAFLLATYGSRSGTFGFIAPPSLPQNVAFQLDYTSPTQLYARMVAPVPQTYVSTAATGNFGTAASWNNAAAPGTASSVTIANALATAQAVTVAASTTVHRVSLSSTGGGLNLQVPQGIVLGIANQLLVGPGATLTGGGTILGNVQVTGGTVYPGAASSALTVRGSMATQTGSNLRFDLSGISAGQANQLDVSNTLILGGGTLTVNDTNGFTPAAGDTFQILNVGSVSGQFDQFSLPQLSPGLGWNTSQLYTTGTISVGVPEPASLTFLLAGAAAFLGRRRRSTR